MPTVIEKRLALDFPTGWEAVKYDQQADPATGEAASFYRRIIEQGGVTHVRGMDVVCRLPGSPARLQFVEVKDDRQAADAHQRGPRHAALFVAVMQKTAGTLAGLALAERLGEPSLVSFACLSQSPAIEVILFLLEPPPAAASSQFPLYRLARKEGKTTLEQRLAAKLRAWGLPFRLHNLTNRPPAPWHVRELP